MTKIMILDGNTFKIIYIKKLLRLEKERDIYKMDRVKGPPRALENLGNF